MHRNVSTTVCVYFVDYPLLLVVKEAACAPIATSDAPIAFIFRTVIAHFTFSERRTSLEVTFKFCAILESKGALTMELVVLMLTMILVSTWVVVRALTLFHVVAIVSDILLSVCVKECSQAMFLAILPASIVLVAVLVSVCA